MTLTTGQGHTRARAAALHQFLKQTRPRSLPLSPAPLVAKVSPSPEKHLRPEKSGSQYFPTTAPRGRFAGTARRTPADKLAAPPRFPCRVPRSQPGRAPPLIIEDTGFGQRRQRARACLQLPLPTSEQRRLPFSPDSRSRTFSLPAGTRSQHSSSPQHCCFVSDVKSQPLELPVPGPALEASSVSSLPALAPLAAAPQRAELPAESVDRGVGEMH